MFRGSSEERSEEWTGGIPLSKGECILITKEGVIEEWEVIEKDVQITVEGEDKIADISYVLEKK